MVKTQVLTRFALLAAAAAAVGALIAVVLGTLVASWLGWMTVSFVLAAIAVVAWGCFHHNSPLFGRVLGGRAIVTERAVALTFDDGPSPDVTPRVLDALAAGGARATFFVLGRQARQHPEILARIRAEGHEIASHGEDHALLTFADEDEVERQLVQAERAIEAATGEPPVRFFRAPHGFRSPAVARAARKLGYHIVGWTRGVWDTAQPGVDRIVERSVRGLRPGAILLLHDADGSGQGASREQTAEAVPRIVSAAGSMGYRFVTISEMEALQRPRKLLTWRSAVAVAVIAVLVELALWRLDLSAIRAVDIAWWWVVASLLANLVSILFKAVVWKQAIDAAHHVVRYAQIIPALFVGFLLNTLLVARLGEVARISVLSRRLRLDGQPMRTSTIAGTVVTEQVVLAITLAVSLLALASVLSVPRWVVNGVRAVVIAVVGIFLAVVALELLARWRRRRGPATVDRSGAWMRSLLVTFESFLHGVVRGQALWRDPRRAIIAISAGLLSWTAQIAGIYWALRAFEIDEGVGAAAVVFLASTLIQLFPVLPGNIGLFQGAVYLPLTQAYGVSVADALAFSIGLQLIEGALGVGLGFVFLSREGLSLAEARALREDE